MEHDKIIRKISHWQVACSEQGSSGDSQDRAAFISLCEIGNSLCFWKSVVALAAPDRRRYANRT
jgi:hypothetical protein